MANVTLESLEQRVAALEQAVARLVPPVSEPVKFKDWRLAVGSFRGTELTKEIDEAGRQIREADRRATP